MSRQAALLLALAAIAVASALISFGAWVLLRRGASSGPTEDRAPDGREA